MKNEWHLGKVIQVEKHYPGNYGAPGMPREPKKKKTPEQIKKQNETNRAKKIQRLILANFIEGDWHLVLKYKPGTRPDTYQAAQEKMKKFLIRMRTEYKKRGYEFKYIAVTERGKKGQALHHHLIIENIVSADLNTVDMVKKLWKGIINLTDLYEDGDYEKLAAYIVKAETKEEEEQGKATYSRSRNLIIPRPKKRMVKRQRWALDPKPKAGWYIVKDSVVNGVNPITGYPYQYYTMHLLE